MKRISTKRHQTLVKSLRDLEKIIDDTKEHASFIDEKTELTEVIHLLVNTRQRYEILQEKLISLMADYNAIYKDLSTQVLAPKLRRLKKEIKNSSPVYFLFREILNETKSL